jgi:putative ABC transport system permease protein
MGVLTRAVRNVSRRKIRTLLVVIALGFSVAIMTSIPAGIVANQIATQNLAQNYNNIIAQTEATINQTLTQVDCSLSSGFSGYGFRGSFSGYSFGASIMNESLYSDINSIPGVTAVVPIIQVSEGRTETITGFGRTFTRLVPEYIIEGIPLNSSIINLITGSVLPTNVISGTNLHGGESGVVLLSENNTGYFNAGVGDSVTIPIGSQYTFKVVGVYRPSGAGTSQFGVGTSALTLYMNLSDAQAITDNVGKITSLEVFVNSSSYVTPVANAISSLHTELTVTTAQERLGRLQSMQTQYDTMLQNAETTISQTQTAAVEEVAVAVAATGLIVLFVMLYTVRERTREIGILKAIGFSNWNIMSQFMLEGVLMSLMAGAVGIVIGTVGAPFLMSYLLPSINLSGAMGLSRRSAFFGTSLSQSVMVSPEAVLLTFGAAALLGALGSLYPAWRASRTSPMEALKYE